MVSVSKVIRVIWGMAGNMCKHVSVSVRMCACL
jgi:hypothetical protein